MGGQKKKSNKNGYSYRLSIHLKKNNNKNNQEIRDDDENKGICDKSINEMTRFRKAFIFIFGLIVVQGNLQT